jgi:hypothetical protein
LVGWSGFSYCLVFIKKHDISEAGFGTDYKLKMQLT